MFDIDHYIVNLFVNDVLSTTLEVTSARTTVTFGGDVQTRAHATVSMVTKCNEMRTQGMATAIGSTLSPGNWSGSLFLIMPNNK